MRIYVKTCYNRADRAAREVKNAGNVRGDFHVYNGAVVLFVCDFPDRGSNFRAA